MTFEALLTLPRGRPMFGASGMVLNVYMQRVI